MQEHHRPSPSVVVGVDGSRAAVHAALWAADEAVSRDIPLRLICAIPPDGTAQIDAKNEARKLATAELAVRYALEAVEATEKPVKIEVAIIEGLPARTLVDASRSAAMICMGPVGASHFAPGRVGSTAATVAKSARCPAAIIRWTDRASSAERGAILAVVGKVPDSNAVLQTAIDEALLRGARLCVLTMWQSRSDDVHDGRAAFDGTHDAQAQLDRLVHAWGRRYPDVAISALAVHGSLVHHLVNNPDSIQLVVMGACDRDVAELVGPAGNAALQAKDCSVLIVSSQHL
jgi:nucleotide-binding universal stress UspA family protein